jgi:hypothetical protein
MLMQPIQKLGIPHFTPNAANREFMIIPQVECVHRQR